MVDRSTSVPQLPPEHSLISAGSENTLGVSNINNFGAREICHMYLLSLTANEWMQVLLCQKDCCMQNCLTAQLWERIPELKVKTG